MFKSIFTKFYKNKLIYNKIVCKRTFKPYPGYKTSFQYHLLDYLENLSSARQTMPVISAQHEYKSSLNDTSTESKSNFVIKNLHKRIIDLSNIKDKYRRVKLAHELFAKCLDIIDIISPSEILKLLNALFKVVPSTTPSSLFYKESIVILIKAVENGLLNKHEIVQLLFFISLNKNLIGENDFYFLQPYIPNMNELSLIEKCIVAQSLHKFSVKLPINQLDTVRKTIEENFGQLIQDFNYLTSLCKILIDSDKTSDLPLKCLSKAVSKWNEPLTFNIIVNILKLYAYTLSYDLTVLNCLVTKSIKYIEEDMKKQELHIRDLDFFLWSTSYLGFNLSTTHKNLLKNYFKLRLKEYQKKINVGSLINTILFLHMHHISDTEDIIQKCLDEDIFDILLREQFHWKIKSNFQLLIYQISLDTNIKFPPKLKIPVEVGFIVSEDVKLVAEIAKKLIAKNIVDEVTIECPIPSLTIPGVTLGTKTNKYHIDVLNNLTCLKNTNVPHGLMNLKLHLLGRLAFWKILIPGEILSEDPKKQQLIQERIIDSMNVSSIYKNTALINITTSMKLLIA